MDHALVCFCFLTSSRFRTRSGVSDCACKLHSRTEPPTFEVSASSTGFHVHNQVMRNLGDESCSEKCDLVEDDALNLLQAWPSPLTRIPIKKPPYFSSISIFHQLLIVPVRIYCQWCFTGVDQFPVLKILHKIVLYSSYFDLVILYDWILHFLLIRFYIGLFRDFFFIFLAVLSIVTKEINSLLERNNIQSFRESFRASLMCKHCWIFHMNACS